ncbi:protein phosphatase 2C containing protein (macronuclear) [Tetrahymena thermophila SB210]|uniref:Protein phosphatase 2C containing protein n=1 Tax=Tetrahymena thermophila (strain SB210) TaxID=312017 RepID=I7MD42_TETTS|nr:protein phosphatase 2C containing protein [Tetrahymena thermophila SB210]EAR85459.4 protein phosphatase 2C containing protein [Tetrahymena thermophila SB210]|eukprot:XP_001033122.4 protein phosphatase 2C containing protein [Tetrahymena thermophila SB210]
MDDHRRHHQMIDEGGNEANDQCMKTEESNGTPVFNYCIENKNDNFFPSIPPQSNQATSDNTYQFQKPAISSIPSNKSNKKGGNFTFDMIPLKEQSQQNENIPQNFQPLPSPPKQKIKQKFELFLDISHYEKQEKEIPLQTDGNSQKKKQDVFDFQDVHEYTGFCDVAMKKCSRDDQQDRFSAISPLDPVENDDAFFAVYDGHGTSYIAEQVKNNLHQKIKENKNYPQNIIMAVKQSFEQIDKEICNSQESNSIQKGGTTALCCLIKGDTIYIINCGDSLSVLFTYQNETELLNKLHKPSNENEKIMLNQKNAIYTEQRVSGTLSVTRAIGDHEHKQFITSEPEIFQYTINENQKYLFLGTDGFWDIISYKDKLPELLQKRNDQNIQNLSTYLVEEASNTVTTTKKDNMTLLAIDLNYYYRQNNEAKENQSMQAMQESNCIKKSKQIQINTINTEISSYFFQAKSPCSVGRSTEKRNTIGSSVSQKSYQQQELKTCHKIQQKRAFFASENTDEEQLSKSEDMGKLDSIIQSQKEIHGVEQNGNLISQSVTSMTDINIQCKNEQPQQNQQSFNLQNSSNMEISPVINTTPNSSQKKFSFQFPISNNNSSNNQVPSRQMVIDNKQNTFFQF